jgi:hypothetical protein
MSSSLGKAEVGLSGSVGHAHASLALLGAAKGEVESGDGADDLRLGDASSVLIVSTAVSR